MGETIRSLMVAALAMATLFAACRPVAAQGFHIPQSLANAVGGATEAVANQGGGRSMPLPNFTAGGDDAPARSRSGGPTTEPVTGRDRNWMVGGETARPTTDPLPRGGNPALPPQSNSQARPGARSKSGTPGFAGLPEGVRLPPRTGGGQTGQTFGSEFARETSSGSTPSRPVYGPPTAEQANFDWSAYNDRQDSETSRSNSADRGGSGVAATTRPDAASEYRRQAQAAQAAAAQPSSSWSTGSGLGLPGQAGRNSPPGQRASADRNLPTTDWTADQIAALGAQFNIPGNDPRLQDQQFVNDLYVRYREWQQRQASVGTSTATPSGGRQTFDQDSLGNSRSSFGDPAAYPGGGGSLAAWPSARESVASDSPPALSDPRDRRGAIADRNEAAGATSTTPRTPRRRQLYDAFGNRVDEQGNVLDEHGNPVDEATAYEMTIGKKLREDMAKLAKQQADLMRETAEQSMAGSPLRVASAGSTAGGRVPTGSPSDRPVSPSSAAGTAIPGQDPSVNSPAGPGADPDRPKIDQAGLGGGAQAIGRSNPYVNVFLLCSLVSNAFLFVWLHRLWHHHRDLIASTRMASSGISSKD